MGNLSEHRPPIIDLFAGVGGLSLGACRAGFELIAAVEKDPHAAEAHAKNFPTCIHSTADISTLSGQDLLALAGLRPGELAGLVGGPPCQGFSTIGHRSKADHRNTLFRKFFALVAETRPWFFLAENVPGILDDDFGPIRSDALAQLTGYTIIPPFKVTASDFGAPTTRTRVLFIGYLPEITNISEADLFPKAPIEKITVQEALRGLPKKIRNDWITESLSWRQIKYSRESPFWSKVTAEIPPGVGDPNSIAKLTEKRLVSGCIATLHTPAVRKRFAKVEAGETDAISRAMRLKPRGFCPTLRAGTGSDRGSYQAVRPIHPTENRVITPREAARLQGFPDWFQFSPTKWHSFRQIGNSVSPLLAEHILRSVLKKLPIRPSSTAENVTAA